MVLANMRCMATTMKNAAKKGAVKNAGASRKAAGKTATGKKGAATKSAAKKTVVAKKARAKQSIAKSVAKKSGGTGSGAAKPLAAYNAKRDFTRTDEPAGRVPKATGKKLHFVVQKHAASHLHYDFRLELDGVMKSWAVPKGPSLDPAVRRLAMEVEDHPIEYNTFEGTIPAGEYGGGTVMLWDRGTYDAEDGGGAESLRDGYRRGDLKVTLSGARLVGSWVLVRMKREGKPQWLLIKHRDEHADPSRDITAEEETSVVTKRSMEQISEGKRVWHSDG